jgi:hypothetical protein
MTPSATFELRSTHPLAGPEGWPRTGPIYGILEEERRSRQSFWEKISQRIRKSPDGDGPSAGQARIWY